MRFENDKVNNHHKKSVSADGVSKQQDVLVHTVASVLCDILCTVIRAMD